MARRDQVLEFETETETEGEGLKVSKEFRVFEGKFGDRSVDAEQRLGEVFHTDAPFLQEMRNFGNLESEDSSQEDNLSSIASEFKKTMDLPDFSRQTRHELDFDKRKKNVIVCMDLVSRDISTISFSQLKQLATLSIINTRVRPDHTSDVMFWVDVQRPDADLFRDIENLFSIHPITVDDINSPKMTEKMDMTDDYLYVKVTEREPFRQKGKKGVAAPKLNKKLNQQSAKNYQVQKSRKPKTPNAINMLMFKNIILSIHFHNFNSMIPAMFRLTYKHPDNNSSTASHPAWVIYSVLDEIVDVYTSHVDKAEESIKILDEAIDTIEIQEHPLFLARVAQTRAAVVNLASELFQKRELLVRLKSSSRLSAFGVFPETERLLKSYFDDVLDHLVVMFQRSEMESSMMESLLVNYHGRIEFQSSQKMHETNRVMKRFSAVATIFLPATFVTSLWGMNVPVPGQYWPGGLIWFFLILGALILYCLVVSIIFWRKKWF
eukprot:TRINITY_DN13896_c0_g1_i1.p1 TRINITY_DN13896_c0_g1~~TRINITY_DN13896_c0_g1_i1.p1  ORF type:complete len:492 (-),score=194.29 TRINITY_DN13896_c0_g1_i1:87-1562(-)